MQNLNSILVINEIYGDVYFGPVFLFSFSFFFFFFFLLLFSAVKRVTKSKASQI